MPPREDSSESGPEVLDAAEELYFGLLESATDGTLPAVEELCRQHPELAAALREVDASYRRGLAAVEPRDADAGAGPASTIAERYEVRREIASGGMGTVLEVWDRELRRGLAMKLVRGAGRLQRPRDWDQRQRRLRNEARVLARLVHPGILPLHDVGTTAEGDAFFTMQLVRGRHLGEVIDEAHRGGGEWTVTRLLGVLQRVCDAMAYAHSEGVVHRDLKPNNVMVGPFGETYVLDWGLAWVRRPERGRAATPERTDSDDDHPAASGVGTPAYMPPEQATATPAAVDERADVYGVGAILYHVLSGHRPYAAAGDSPLALIRAVRARPPAPLARAARGQPAELVAIAERAMARDPAQRYPSMAALAGDLRAYLENRVVRAHRTGAWVELRKWVQRNRGFAAAVATLIVGLGVVVLLQAEANRALRRRDYRYKVALAGHAAERGDVRAVRELLAACAPGLRGWEWHAIRRLSDASDRVLAAHDDAVLCVAFGPGGRHLFTGGRDGRAHLWRRDDGALIRSWELDDFVLSAAFLDRERLLLVVGAQIVELHVDADAPLRTVAAAAPDQHLTAALSPDRGQLLVGGANGLVERWDVERLAREAVLLEGLYGVSQLAWSPDGRLAAVAGRDREDDAERASVVRVLDAASGELEHELAGHRNWIASVAFDPGGARLASAGWDGRVRVWSLADGSLVRELPEVWSGPVTLSWPRDDLLIVGGRPAIHLWELDSTDPPRVLVGHADPVAALAFRDDLLASAGTDATTRLWQLDAAAGRHERRSEGAGAGIALRSGARSGEFVVAGAAGFVEVWEAAGRVRRRETALPCQRTLVAYADGGRWLLTGDFSGRLSIHDADTCEQVGTVQAHGYAVAGLAAHPSRPLAVTTSSEGRARIWSLRPLEPLREIEAGTVDRWPPGAHECAFSPDGRVIAIGANDRRLRIVDTDTGAPRRELTCDAEGHTYGAPVFSPDGHRLVARVWNRRASDLVAWDLDAERVEWIRAGGRHAFTATCFTADGSRLLTCNDNGELVVIDAENGVELVTLPAPSPQHVLGAAMCGDVLVQTTEHTVRFWDGSPEEEPR